MCFYVLLFSNAVDNKALPWCHLFSGFSMVLWVPSESNGSMGIGSIEVFLEICDNVFLHKDPNWKRTLEFSAVELC